ncbi:hypothetical protein [Nocardia carnea]|uniref:hypothetical protein n=1 Tax=Nocardia carnea TaxID=37328 RepID=UPI0032AF7B2B
MLLVFGPNIKTFRRHADKVLPDRGQVTMTQPFLKAYSELQHEHVRKAGGRHAQVRVGALFPMGWVRNSRPSVRGYGSGRGIHWLESLYTR